MARQDVLTCFVELDVIRILHELLVVDRKDPAGTQPRVERVERHEDLLTQQVVVTRQEVLHSGLVARQVVDTENWLRGQRARYVARDTWTRVRQSRRFFTGDVQRQRAPIHRGGLHLKRCVEMYM